MDTILSLEIIRVDVLLDGQKTSRLSNVQVHLNKRPKHSYKAVLLKGRV